MGPVQKNGIIFEKKVFWLCYLNVPTIQTLQNQVVCLNKERILKTSKQISSDKIFGNICQNVIGRTCGNFFPNLFFSGNLYTLISGWKKHDAMLTFSSVMRRNQALQRKPNCARPFHWRNSTLLCSTWTVDSSPDMWLHFSVTTSDSLLVL